MKIRGLLAGVLMVALGALFAWVLGGALELRAEKEQPTSPAGVAMPSTEKHHWMF
jgi:hypothetical protein